MKTALPLAIILLGALMSGPALAGQGQGGSHSHGGFHGHRGGGVFIGGPVFWPWYYPPYYYYYPPYYYPSYYYYPPYAAGSFKYIEQGSEQAPAQSQAYWYYCSDTQSYYPYVKECPGGWQRVAPQPPPGP